MHIVSMKLQWFDDDGSVEAALSGVQVQTGRRTVRNLRTRCSAFVACIP